MNRFKNYLFDWDGTLIDAIQAHEESFLAVLKDVESDKVNSFNYKSMRGKKTIEVFKELGVTEKLNELVICKQSLYREKLNSGAVKLFPGVVELLKFIKNDLNSNIYIVTGASLLSLELGITLNKLNDYIDGYVCGNEVVNGKPDPESYFKCIAKYALNVNESCAVEDAVDGVSSAKSAGLFTFGVNDISVKSKSDLWLSSIQKLNEFLELQ